MKSPFPVPPEPCRAALADIEQDPLRLPMLSEAHVRTCVACAEVRVAWLAQADSLAQAPPGYFDQLPDRILSKLPTRQRRRTHPVLWALAAALLLVVGGGGYWVGRANREPMVEATLAPAVQEHDALPDTPFLEGEEDYAQLPNLSPEQAHQLIERVRGEEARP
jgi:hypothetical protein